MRSTTRYKRGDIVLVSFPFTDLSAAKKRPALVVSPDSFNARQDDLVLAAVTSHLTDDPHGIRLQQTDCRDGTLPRPSMVRATKIFTIQSTLILKKICRVRGAKVQAVLDHLQRFFSYS